jgi:hypothetical protein
MVWYEAPRWIRHPIAPGDYKYGRLADLDGDGDLDAVAGRHWFENPGADRPGDWTAHPLGFLDEEPDLVHVADVNGDTRADVVIATKHALSWLAAPADPRSTWPRFVVARDPGRRTGGAVADLDGDGDPDILWGSSWYENAADLREDLWPAHVIDADWPSEARGAVGDLDGDLRPDVVLSGEESERGIAWYPGPPDPRAGPWTRRPIVSRGYEGVHSLAVSDFDRDGDLDVFAAEMHHGKDPDKIAVFENVRADSNRWTEHVIGLTGSHNARVGDLDGDGWPDIAGKNYEAGAEPLRVEAWLNRIPGALALDRWKRWTIEEARPWVAVFLDAGDVDGDGDKDLVTGGWWYENPGGLSRPWVRHDVGGELYNMAAVADFDGDGDLDVLGTRGKMKSCEFLWAENDGAGRFLIHETIPDADGDFLQGARVAQILPGAGPEVVLSWHNGTSTQMYRVPEERSQRWSWEVLSPTTNSEQIAVFDVDGDGDLDVHLGTAWLRNDATAWTPFPAVSIGVPGADPDRVEAADIDEDGDLDVVIGCEHARAIVWGECPAEPSEPWTEHVVSTEIQAMSLDVGDLDRDGDIDIVAGEHNRKRPDRGRVIIYQNGGWGRSWTARVIDEGLEHHLGTRFVDIDGDGDLDVVSMGITHGRIVVYENLAL